MTNGQKHEDASHAGREVLVVDDNPENLRVLSQLFEGEGYRVRVARDGAQALRSARVAAPDLVLLDVHMPKMDGYETCRELRSTPELAEVPVIFVSGLTEPFNKTEAFAAGGVDYVTKPFQADEVLARVSTHLRIARLQRELSVRNAELVRERELQQSLVAMVVHDMRSPLTAIGAALELLELDSHTLTEDAKENVALIQAGQQALGRIVRSLLDVHRLEAGQLPLQLASVPLARVLASCVAESDLLGATGRTTLVTPPTDDVRVIADESLLRRVVSNLLDNAYKHAPGESPVLVHASCTDRHATVSVIDRGPGIAPEHAERIFEKFFRVSAESSDRSSTGLGLAFCRLAVEAQGGTIGVSSAPGEGATFHFTLPLEVR